MKDIIFLLCWLGILIMAKGNPSEGNVILKFMIAKECNLWTYQSWYEVSFKHEKPLLLIIELRFYMGLECV